MIENIKLIYILIGLYACGWLSNSIFGILLNVKEIGMKFDIKLLLNSLVKAILLLTGTTLTVVGISYLPEILANQDIVLVHNNLIENVSLLAIIGIFVSAIYKYLGQAIDKLKTILTLTEIDLIELKYEQLADDDDDVFI